jgi:ABC-2 type transport system permease protein
VTAFACYGAGYLVLSKGGAPTAALNHPGVLRAVVLSGAFLSLLGLFALGLGIILRYTAGAISAYVGFTFLLPLLLSRLPGNPSRFTPVPMLLNSVAAVIPQSSSLSAPTACGFMAAYSAGCLLIATAVFLRRDA